MEIFLVIAFGLAIIAGIIYGFLWMVDQINQHCLDKYGYEPITWGKAFWIIILAASLLFSLVANNKGDMGTFALLLIVGGVIAFLLFYRIASKTSIPMATLSSGVLVLAAILIVFWIALAVMSSDNRRRSYWD